MIKSYMVNKVIAINMLFFCAFVFWGFSFHESQTGTDSIPHLIQSLGSDDKMERKNAMRRLKSLGNEAKPASQALLRVALNDPNYETARTAVRTLKLVDLTASREVMHVCIENLKSEEPSIRGRALYILGTLGVVAKKARPAITKALEDPNPVVKRRAKLALKSFSLSANYRVGEKVDLREFTDNIRFEDAESTIYDMRILVDAGPRAASETAFLGRALKHENALVRYIAAEILGSMGPAVEAAVPDLIYTLENDAESVVRQNALEALEAIGTPKALEAASSHGEAL